MALENSTVTLPKLDVDGDPLPDGKICKIEVDFSTYPALIIVKSGAGGPTIDQFGPHPDGDVAVVRGFYVYHLVADEWKLATRVAGYSSASSGAPDNDHGKDGDSHTNRSNRMFSTKKSGSYVNEGTFMPTNISGMLVSSVQTLVDGDTEVELDASATGEDWGLATAPDTGFAVIQQETGSKGRVYAPAPLDKENSDTDTLKFKIPGRIDGGGYTAICFVIETIS